MLEAGWQLYEGEYFRQRVEISSKELEFLTSRMTSLATTGSVLAGFAFNALVELDITQDVEEDLKDVGYVWIEDVYYIATGCTMAAGVYIVVVATIAVMKAQRQALHGHVELSFLREELPTNLGYRPGMIGENYQNAGMPRAGETPVERERRAMLQEQQAQNDDVQQAIFALRKVQPVLLFAFGASLGPFVIAATAMSWIKTVYHHKQILKRDEDSWNTIAIILTTAFGMLGLAIVAVRTRARATPPASQRGPSYRIAPTLRAPSSWQAVCWMNSLFNVDTFHGSSTVAPARRQNQHGAPVDISRQAQQLTQPLRSAAS